MGQLLEQGVNCYFVHILNLRNSRLFVKHWFPLPIVSTSFFLALHLIKKFITNCAWSYQRITPRQWFMLSDNSLQAVVTANKEITPTSKH